MCSAAWLVMAQGLQVTSQAWAVLQQRFEVQLVAITTLSDRRWLLYCRLCVVPFFLWGYDWNFFFKYLFGHPLGDEPHPYVCHKISSGLLFTKISIPGWHGGICWGSGRGEESVSNATKIVLLEISMPCAWEVPYVKAKKKCLWKETPLHGHLACKYICAHICAGMYRYRSLTSIFWRWSKVSITQITAVKPVF